MTSPQRSKVRIKSIKAKEIGWCDAIEISNSIWQYFCYQESMKWIGILTVFCFNCVVFGQDTVTSVKPPDIERPRSKPIEFPDIMPFDCVSDAQFPGGGIALVRYISDVVDWSCLTFSEDLLVNSRVYILFSVNEQGEIEDPEILRGIHPEIDQYCLEIVQEMPKWIPAIDCEQKPIKQKMALPITICLD